MKSGARILVDWFFRFRRGRIVVSSLLCAAIALAGHRTTIGAIPQDSAGDASTQSKEPDPPAKDRKPAAHPRVIVKVNRRLTIQGTLVTRDDELITFKDLKGELHSYPISRVLQITELVEPKPGQTGVVFMNDGDTRTGVIIEDNYDYVLMEIEGIRAKIGREYVDHVVLEPTVEERYRAFKDQLRPGQTLRHLTLCKWLIDNKEYELAEKELEELLEYEENAEAKRLLTIVKAQLELKSGGFKTTPEQRAADDHPEDTGEKPKTGPVYAKDMLPQQILTAEDVNIIRVYELDFDNPPRVAISADTIRQLIQRYGTSPLMPASQTDRTALFRADPIDIVRLMFELKARDLYPQIQVLTEPTSLNQFRQYVHDAWLINNCATSRCHGGLEAGRFFLHERNYKSERVRYTNLLILDRLQLDDQYPLVNYEDPMMSLVIQYALPRPVARKPHPDVRGWKPVFTRGNTHMLDESIKWIQQMYQPRPEYPVKFDPPVIGAPTAQAPPDAKPSAAGDGANPSDMGAETPPPLRPAFAGDDDQQPPKEPTDPNRPPRE